MENRKGSGIFLGVIGAATLIVAIIGATFAYFAADAASEEGAITATGAVLKLGYSDVKDGLKHNLIPSTDAIAEFASLDEKWIEDGKRCLDSNGNEVCGYYVFNIGNPSFTTQQGLYGTLKVVSNDFTNLWFMIADETGTIVVPATKLGAADSTVTLSQLDQQLAPSSLDSAETVGFDELIPTTYTKLCTYGEVINEETGETCTITNVRTYTLIMWIQETGTNQTADDSGKAFAASITFTSGSGSSGVTGTISAADKANYGFEDETGA